MNWKYHDSQLRSRPATIGRVLGDKLSKYERTCFNKQSLEEAISITKEDISHTINNRTVGNCHQPCHPNVEPEIIQVKYKRTVNKPFS